MTYTHDEMVKALFRWSLEEGLNMEELRTSLLILARHVSEENLLKLFPLEITAYAYPIEGEEEKDA